MKNVLLILLAALVFTGCKQGDKEKSPGIKEKPDAENTITKDGIGNLKIGMTKTDLEKMLKTKVDLVSSNGLSKHIKPIIDQEKQLIYAR